MDNGQVIAKYIELRDRKDELSKQLSEAAAAQLKPLNDAMETIENFFMDQMNQLGVDNVSVKGVGTVYKKVSTSVQATDMLAFKQFVFEPAVTGVLNYLHAAGYPVRDIDHEAIAKTILGLLPWDMVDFRIGQKAVKDYTVNEQKPVPGTKLSSFTTIQVRRS